MESSVSGQFFLNNSGLNTNNQKITEVDTAFASECQMLPKKTGDHDLSLPDVALPDRDIATTTVADDTTAMDWQSGESRSLPLRESACANATSMCTTDLPIFNNLVADLDQCDADLPRRVMKKLRSFTRQILQLKLPLYVPEIHQVLQHVECLKDCYLNKPDLESIEIALKKMESLYPSFLTSRHPGVFELADLMFASGLIKNNAAKLVKKFGIGDFIKIWIDPDENLPVGSFIRHVQPLFDDAKFCQYFTDNPHKFIANKRPEYFQCWKSLVDKNCPHLMDVLIAKNISEIEFWQDFPELFFLENFDQLKHGISDRLDMVCKNTVPQFNRELLRCCPLIKALTELLHRPTLAEPVTDLLAIYFSGLTAQQQQHFSVTMLTQSPVLFDLLVNRPLAELMCQKAIDWRSSSNKTILHLSSCGSAGRFGLIAPTLLQAIMSLPGGPALLSARDDNDKTALESFFDFDGSLDDESKSLSALGYLLERTPVAGIKLCHAVELFNKVPSNNGFHAWLSLQILRNPHWVRGGREAISAVPLVGDFQQQFINSVLFCRGESSQAELLRQWQGLPFSSEALMLLAREFPASIRALLFPDPFATGNRHLWEKQVIPFAVLRGAVRKKITLPWTPFLQQAAVCFSPPASPTLLAQWRQAVDVPDVDLLPLLEQKLPSGDSGRHGRSCFFHDPENGKTLRLKFRKKLAGGAGEPWGELACEPGKLNCLKRWQAEGLLPLQTRFPTPLGLFRIRDFEQWLLGDDIPLSLADLRELWKCVFVEEDGSALVYAYETELQQQFHHYPYETEGEGLSVELSLESLQIAANDLGQLLGIGLAATTRVPMHRDDNRFFVMLTQLIGHQLPGQLVSWNHDASNFPNVSPGVGIRDYANIIELTATPVTLDDVTGETPENRQIMHLEQIAREFFSLIILLPRVFEQELSMKSAAAMEKKVHPVINRMSCAFFSGALGLSEDEIGKCLENYGVTAELARVICFWCQTGPNPGWVNSYRAGGVMPRIIFPDLASILARKIKSCSDNDTLMDRGWLTDTHSKGLDLGSHKGIFPLLPFNKLLTMVLTLHTHKQKHVS